MEDQEPIPLRIQDPAGGVWHADRRIPIAVLGALLLQFAGFIWWSSKEDSRLDNLEKTDVRHEITIGQMSAERRSEHDRVVVLEGDQKHTIELLQRIEAKVDKIIK